MIAATLAAMAAIASTPSLGTEEGRCRSPEPGPAFEVMVAGLKDRSGELRLELYPDNDADFFADDNKLLAAGKTFARVIVAPPAAGAVEMCIRAPHPGRYALMLLHNRNAGRKFDLTHDGVGFAGNPRLGWSKPRAASAAAVAGPGLTRLTIILNYWHGLSMRPVEVP
ncbi:DUF2141 domain-containing protein [Rhizorhabdus argentea]|uniref:DUF2141 domain-containing protein n=1 Tax=Rhizorhabdus argentea TaxID=1387174 RepID=UPI0030EB96B6